jgi:hypothetical protein
VTNAFAAFSPFGHWQINGLQGRPDKTINQKVPHSFTSRVTLRTNLVMEPLRNFQFWPLENLDDITRTGTADGPGNLYFAKKAHYNSTTRRTTLKAIGFIGIDQPLKLEQAILEAQQSLKSSAKD